MVMMAAHRRLLGRLPLLVLFQLLIVHIDSFIAPRVDSVRANPNQQELLAISSTLTSREDLPASVVADTSRRDLLQGSVAFLLLASFVGSTAAQAAEKVPAQGLLSTASVADLLRVIPTFTIVDQKGAPFMVVGEDAKVTGYFFTEFSEAQRILKLASKSADKSIAEGKKDPKQKEFASELTNPWKAARISTVPLDLAATMVTKSMYASAKSGGNYFQVAPSEADVEDALRITGKDDLPEGKVPLFYLEDFTVETNNGSSQSSPLYFRKAELVKAFKKANPGQPLPTILVTELFAVVAKMVLPGETDQDFQTLVFVPPAGSLEKAKECERKGGMEAAFTIGQRNLVL